ncbi:MAG TPA: hypothetical protein PLM09_14635 [Casimicrobiaceae bacterium]|mgnify:CR=1 FL=1|nr:hypothetical protein [Casimicrobiaceae bacterium]
MIGIEMFLGLAAVVVVVGFIVWRRDVKAGRVMRTTTRGPVTVMRERFTGRGAAPPSAAPGPASPATKAAPSGATRTNADEEGDS